MNNRLLIGSLVLAASVTGWSGCAKTQTRNSALFGGSNSALTEANAGPGGEFGNSAMGSVPQPKKTSTTDRLLSPLRSVKNTFTPQPVKSDTPPDPISLSNATPKPSPDLFLSAARVIATSGNHTSAQSLYEQALIADPNNRDAMLELARIYVQQDQEKMARDIYLKAVEVHPQDPIVFNDLGLFHLQVEDANLGIKAFQRAVQLDPKRALYRNNLANAYVVNGQNELALRELMAIDAKPVAHYNLGYLLYTHQKYLPAIEQFDLAFQEDDQFYDAYVMKTRLMQEWENEKAHRPESYVRPVSYQATANPGDAKESDQVSQAKTAAQPPSAAKPSHVRHAAATTPADLTKPATRSRPTPQATERIGGRPVIERTPDGSTAKAPTPTTSEPRVFNLSDQEASEMQPISQAELTARDDIRQVSFDATQATGSSDATPMASIRLADFEAPIEADSHPPQASRASFTQSEPHATNITGFAWAYRIWNQTDQAAASNSQEINGISYPMTDAPRLLGTPHVDGQLQADQLSKPELPQDLRTPTSNAANVNAANVDAASLIVPGASAELDARMLISPSQYLPTQESQR